MLPSSVIEELFAWTHETAHIEWKAGGDLSDKSYVALIARAVMAMANRRGGGYVIVGIHESLGPDQRMTGLSESQLKQWEYDEVAEKLREWMQPLARFEIERVIYREKSYIVLNVTEFDDQPIICSRDYPNKLQRGACYIRPRAMARSVPVNTYEDMRDLLDLAVEKQLQRQLALIHAAGLLNSPDTGVADSQKYEVERGNW